MRAACRQAAAWQQERLQVAVSFKYDNAIAQAVTTLPAGLLGPSPVNFFANNSSQFLSTLGIHVTF